MQNETRPREEGALDPTHIKRASERAAITDLSGKYKIYTTLNNTSLVDMRLADHNGIHNVKLFHDSDAPESTWIFSYQQEKGGYLIINGLRGTKVLGSDTALSVIASNLTMRPAQIWEVFRAGSETVFFQDRHDGKIMEVKDSNTADNTNIIIGDPSITLPSRRVFKLHKISGPR